MKAAQLTAPRKMEIVEVEAPNIEDGEVLVRVDKVSICGSDLRPFSVTLPEEQYPVPPGRPTHECAGVVEESRSDAFNPGDRVIAFPFEQGGFRETLSMSPDNLVAVPQQGSLDTWIMCQPMGTVLYAVNRMGNVIDKNIVVLGQGAIGLSFTRFLSGMACRELITVDLEDYRLDLSTQMGATRTLNPLRDNVTDAIAELTGGVGADVVVEAAGLHETVRHAIVLAKQFGSVILFGITHSENFPVDFKQIRDKDLTMVATSSARTGMMPQFVRQAVHMVDQGRLDPTPLITHHLKADQVQDAFLMYEERRDGIIKVVMDW